jgi:hypothetical protein
VKRKDLPIGHPNRNEGLNEKFVEMLLENKLQVYADRGDLQHVQYHVPVPDAVRGEPRFANLNKKTKEWTSHDSKYNDAPVISRGKGEASMHAHFNALHRDAK